MYVLCTVFMQPDLFARSLRSICLRSCIWSYERAWHLFCFRWQQSFLSNLRHKKVLFLSLLWVDVNFCNFLQERAHKHFEFNFQTSFPMSAFVLPCDLQLQILAGIVVESDEICWLVLDFLSGGTLKAWLYGDGRNWWELCFLNLHRDGRYMILERTGDHRWQKLLSLPLHFKVHC